MLTAIEAFFSSCSCIIILIVIVMLAIQVIRRVLKVLIVLTVIKIVLIILVVVAVITRIMICIRFCQCSCLEGHCISAANSLLNCEEVQALGFRVFRHTQLLFELIPFPLSRTHLEASSPHGIPWCAKL